MVSMGTVKTLLTFAEFEQLPERPGKDELIRGELIELPPAEYKHSELAHRIFHIMDSAIEQAHARGKAGELGEVFHEMGYRLPGEGWLQPDVSVTRARQSIDEYLLGAPAIAIEVISAANTAKRVDAKAELYFEFGAREVWRVFQRTRQITIQVPGSARVMAADQAVTTPLLPGFAIPIQEIFGE